MKRKLRSMIGREKSNKHWIGAAERVVRIDRSNHINAENFVELRKSIYSQIEETSESQRSLINKNKILRLIIMKVKNNRSKGGKRMISATDKLWIV